MSAVREIEYAKPESAQLTVASSSGAASVLSRRSSSVPDESAGPSGGQVLRLARGRLGLTQHRAARMLGTKQSNISSYERGELTPGHLVSTRIKALAALSVTSAYREADYSTMPSLAHEIRGDLHRQDPWQATLRLIIQASDDFEALTSDLDRRLFLSEPSTTGNHGYDALLAALAVHLSRRARLGATPAWTRAPNRYLDTFWWFGSAGSSPGLQAFAFQRTPAAFRARGVVFNIDNLASV